MQQTLPTCKERSSSSGDLLSSSSSSATPAPSAILPGISGQAPSSVLHILHNGFSLSPPTPLNQPHPDRNGILQSFCLYRLTICAQRPDSRQYPSHPKGTAGLVLALGAGVNKVHFCALRRDEQRGLVHAAICSFRPQYLSAPSLLNALMFL